MNRDPGLTDRVALVTGAASGIGAATARLLAEQGAVVVCTDLDGDAVETIARGLPGRPARGLPLDVRDEAAWARAIESTLRHEGRVDVLVHGAGISAASPLRDTTLADWRRVLDTNLNGTFLAIRAGIRAMEETGGAIAVIGSASGIRPAPGAAAYSTSKAALRMLVQTAAKECKELGIDIRINLISPGGVKTPMWRAMPFFQDLVSQHGSEEAAFAALAGWSEGVPPSQLTLADAGSGNRRR
jgi:NAD(P)-dependent dehydrogenase (short-subunit alcohol dehydrogenase family)